MKTIKWLVNLLTRRAEYDIDWTKDNAAALKAFLECDTGMRLKSLLEFELASRLRKVLKDTSQYDWGQVNMLLHVLERLEYLSDKNNFS